MSVGSRTLWNALIRTHHITSRKKVGKLKQAASEHGVFALLRSGGIPGIMYVEGPEEGVVKWVDAVHALRYKDYHVASQPAMLDLEVGARKSIIDHRGLTEVDTVKKFGDIMLERGVYTWWRKAMGYASQDDRL
ncbi:hypothetical protein BAUCODRAFT_124851 [Baudoinia panamericana UAMH 10762]|uniref:Uncharacterized protein n=1 Tax=Baudoinia panamericana (strain UAMH 10762) TaxID=717646 RepID=M2LIV2_BAUPA|nr:uncharacterized protein BAUCODRAFT_124851 [Baudoinia panamericana UAMH 10762]EMC94127.1 hypothetical protein BAUCODRAFT_124851 [Baudoinia panamericana UAMH 10762]